MNFGLVQAMQFTCNRNTITLPSICLMKQSYMANSLSVQLIYCYTQATGSYHKNQIKFIPITKNWEREMDCLQ